MRDCGNTCRKQTCILHQNGWADYFGRALDARDLGALLRPYEIESRQVRSGEATAKGCRRDDFHQAWTRYLPEAEIEEVVLA